MELHDKFSNFHGVERKKIQWNPIIDENKCIGCGMCVTTCGRGVFKFDSRRKKAVVVNPNACMVACQTCANLCPVNAISFAKEGKTREKAQEIMVKNNLLINVKKELEDRKEELYLQRQLKRNIKTIHFDTHPSAKPYKRAGDVYITKDVNSYIKSNRSFEADVVTGFTCSKFNRDVIDKIKGLKLIVTRSIGYDNIDQNYCKQKGIKFSNVDYSRYNVAHHTWSLILHGVRSLNSCFKQTRDGIFCDEIIECPDLKQMTLGIIGFGKIGYEVFNIAKAFGSKVIAYDTNPKQKYKEIGPQFFEYKDFEYVLENSDIISLHCDANPTSIGMIDNKAIRLMKKKAILINTARGSIIKEGDLIKNISKFAYVGLDVVTDENKFDKSNPLLKYPNIFITPHIAHKSPITVKERWLNAYSIIDNFLKN